MFAGILEPMFYHNYMMQTNSLTDWERMTIPEVFRATKKSTVCLVM
jgi:hypothetical protein